MSGEPTVAPGAVPSGATPHDTGHRPAEPARRSPRIPGLDQMGEDGGVIRVKTWVAEMPAASCQASSRDARPRR